MSQTYEPSQQDRRGRKQKLAVPLDGIPTLPDELTRQIAKVQSGGYVEPEPEGELLEECQASIDAACREIRRRYERQHVLRGRGRNQSHYEEPGARSQESNE